MDSVVEVVLRLFRRGLDPRRRLVVLGKDSG